MARRAAMIALLLGIAACAAPAPKPAAPAAPPPAPAAPAASCPEHVQGAARSGGGACLEAAVLGDEVVTACVAWFESERWVRDGAAEQAIGGQTGKTLVCYRAP